MKKEALIRAGIRFGKVLVAVIIAGLGVKYGKSDWYIVVAPLLVAVDKYIRDSK